MSRIVIPTEGENPQGLHKRYKVLKEDGSPVDPRALYMVLRLDSFGRDPGHIKACRAAARAYVANAPQNMQQVAGEIEKLLDQLEVDADS